jgi:hypothetical protein
MTGSKKLLTSSCKSGELGAGKKYESFLDKGWALYYEGLFIICFKSSAETGTINNILD